MGGGGFSGDGRIWGWCYGGRGGLEGLCVCVCVCVKRWGGG